jgi:hypothetical protein
MITAQPMQHCVPDKTRVVSDTGGCTCSDGGPRPPTTSYHWCRQPPTTLKALHAKQVQGRDRHVHILVSVVPALSLAPGPSRLFPGTLATAPLMHQQTDRKPPHATLHASQTKGHNRDLCVVPAVLLAAAPSGLSRGTCATHPLQHCMPAKPRAASDTHGPLTCSVVGPSPLKAFSWYSRSCSSAASAGKLSCSCLCSWAVSRHPRSSCSSRDSLHIHKVNRCLTLHTQIPLLPQTAVTEGSSGCTNTAGFWGLCCLG